MVGDLWTAFCLFLVSAGPLALYSATVLPLWYVAAGAVTLLAAAFFIRRELEAIEIADLKKKAIFITGCDTGFGNCLALKCLRRGMPVFAGCLTEKGAAGLREAASNGKLPGALRTLIVNVAEDKSVADAVKILEKETAASGGLHGVVNNAGIAANTFYDDFLTVEDYKEVAEVNAFGVVRVTQATKHLVKKARGRIVTTTSVLARVGLAGAGPYALSKFAAAGYCEVIRQELAPFGVSVHILEPGFFKTPITDPKRSRAAVAKILPRTSEAVKDQYDEKFYMKARARSAFLDKMASGNLDLVASAYFHALTARFPRARYQVGPDAHFFWTPLSYCPTGMRDVVMQLFGKVAVALNVTATER